MAGLRCAEVLLKRGMRVTILEGRDRIGGRLHQVEHAGRLIDMGPNWIHGTQENPMLSLAKETGTSLHSWGDRQSMFDENGASVDRESAGMLSSIMWETIAEAFAYSNENSDEIGPDESLLDFFRSRLAGEPKYEMATTTPHPEQGDTKNTLRGDLPNQVDVNSGNGGKRIGPLSEELRQKVLWVSEVWGAYVGEPIGSQSLKYFWLEECIDGENLFVASTYKAILERVAKLPLTEAEVHLSTVVTAIQTPDEEANAPVIVTTATGSTLQFDEVVLTAPLGWLKCSHVATFDPPLPRQLTDAIDAIAYGRLEKVYVTFPTAFWHGPDGEEPDRGFTHWTHPLYAPATNPASWNQEAVSLSTLPSPDAHPTLLYYIHGPCSSHLTGLLATSPPNTHFALLAEFFAPYYSLLPHYSPAHHSPTCMTSTSWGTDALAGHGSYTHFAVGLDGGDRHIERLREGAPQRRLWFAGEHTAPFVALGTVTGAYWAGEAVGQRIGRVYGRSEGA
ncbi:MAG: hypothetical protein M1832_003942 [Thelocarpon impressellum]|nr:MAG: hypothetical protein M1832_003942 [Thelocarpon impressellum]